MTTPDSQAISNINPSSLKGKGEEYQADHGNYGWSYVVDIRRHVLEYRGHFV